jgi:hypothetical protein
LLAENSVARPAKRHQITWIESQIWPGLQALDVVNLSGGGREFPVKAVGVCTDRMPGDERQSQTLPAIGRTENPRITQAGCVCPMAIIDL